MIDQFAQERHWMARKQLEQRGVRDARILAAFEEVPRHLFVPERYRAMAYEDMPLPIGFDQTISQPYIVGVMMTLLGLTGVERVLEVGTGSGYEAALLSKLTSKVHTIELIPELAATAMHVIRDLGYPNVEIHVGDGSLGWPADAPYDGIVAAAAAPGAPRPLLEQLVDGGRLVLPVAHEYEQVLEVFTRTGGTYAERVVTTVAFVPMHGKHGWH